LCFLSYAKSVPKINDMNVKEELSGEDQWWRVKKEDDRS
jgi:hypothetical protein